MPSYGYYLKENAKVWARFWKHVAKYLLLTKRLSLPCGIMAQSSSYCGIMDHLFSNMDGIMGANFESKWHVPRSELDNPSTDRSTSSDGEPLNGSHFINFAGLAPDPSYFVLFMSVT